MDQDRVSQQELPSRNFMRSFQVCIRQELDTIEEMLAMAEESSKMRADFPNTLGHSFHALQAAAVSGNFAPAMRICEFALQILEECRKKSAIYPAHVRALQGIALFLQKYEQFLGMRIGELQPPKNFLVSFDASYQACLEQEAHWGSDAPERSLHERDHLSNASAPPTPSRILDILVVDDEDIVRLFLHDVLEAAGHTVTTAMDGLEAIDLIDRHTFDLIFTDIKMPRADGIQVLKHAKEASPDTEVVVITGYASIESAAKAVHYGAYDYLAKPFDQTSGILGLIRRIQESILLREQNKRLMLELHTRNDELARSVHQLEEALRTVEEKQRALIHADRMASLGVLSAGMAHEINNPTTFIRGNLQTLQKFWGIIAPILQQAQEAASGDVAESDAKKLRFVTEETPGLIDDMLTGTERITRIVSGLRSFVHLGTSTQRDTIRLSEAIDEALNLVQTELRHASIKVLKDYPPMEPAIYADSQQLTQVFVNLFINAMHAMEGMDECCLRIRITRKGDMLEACFSDTGCGMSGQTIERIFTPFYTTKPVGKGTGMGLSISHGIIGEHGGSISVESELGKGATFFITLPICMAEKNDSASRRILVADDEETIRSLIKQVLSRDSRYEVMAVSGGFQALEAVSQFQPHLVILDVRMADMNGSEVLERIRANPKTRDIKVIMITGVVREINMERVEQNKPDEIIFKPFDLRHLLDSIDTLLHPETTTPELTTD